MDNRFLPLVVGAVMLALGLTLTVPTSAGPPRYGAHFWSP